MPSPSQQQPQTVKARITPALDRLESIWHEHPHKHPYFESEDVLRSDLILGACREAIQAGDRQRLQKLLSCERSSYLLNQNHEDNRVQSKDHRSARWDTLWGCLATAIQLCDLPTWTTTINPEAVSELAAEYSLPPGLVLSWVQALLPSALDPATLRPVGNPLNLHAMTVALHPATNVSKGVPSWLTLEAVSPGQGRLYPSARAALTLRKEDWWQTERVVEQFLTDRGYVDPAVDIRWEITLSGGHRPAFLEGDSLGGLLALGAAKAWGRHQVLKDLKLTSLTASAALKPDGAFGPVGAVVEKLASVARENTFPCVTTTLISSAHHDGTPNAHQLRLPEWDKPDASDPRWRYPGREFGIAFVPNFDEAVLAAKAAQDKWTLIDDRLGPHDEFYVPRVGLEREVQAKLKAAPSGHLVVVGGMGRGKTTYLTERIHHLHQQGERPIYHFIRYQARTTPETVIGSLCQQLRLKYGLSLPTDQVSSYDWDRRAENLAHVLQQVSKKLEDMRGTRRTEVIHIDAADQLVGNDDHLLIPGVLPAHLPDGIHTLITTRSDFDRNRILKYQPQLSFVECTDDPADVAAYLRERNSVQRLGLRDEFIQTIISRREKPPVFFTVSKQCRALIEAVQAENQKEQDALRSSVDPWLMAPEKLIQDQADDLVSWADRKGINATEVWHVMGALAFARAELSENILDALAILGRDKLKRILDLASSFFKPLPGRRTPFTRLEFDHPGYAREILDATPAERKCRLSDAARSECHAALGEGALQLIQKALREPDRVMSRLDEALEAASPERPPQWPDALPGPWKDPECSGLVFALREAPYHLHEAGLHQQERALLANLDYLQARIITPLPAPLQIAVEADRISRDLLAAVDAA